MSAAVIRGTIVHHDDFGAEAAAVVEQAVQAVQRVGDLAVDGDDDGDIRCRARRGGQVVGTPGQRGGAGGGVGALHAELPGGEEYLAGAGGGDHRVVDAAVVGVGTGGGGALGCAARCFGQAPGMLAGGRFEPAAGCTGTGGALFRLQARQLAVQGEQPFLLSQQAVRQRGGAAFLRPGGRVRHQRSGREGGERRVEQAVAGAVGRGGMFQQAAIEQRQRPGGEEVEVNFAGGRRRIAQHGDAAAVEFGGAEQRSVNAALGVVGVVGREAAHSGGRQRVQARNNGDAVFMQDFQHGGGLALGRGGGQRGELQGDVR